MQQTDDCACSDAKIAVRDLTKMYGDLTVLDKANFTIKRGELVCIVVELPPLNRTLQALQ